MARNKGLAAFSANFEPQMAAPLDARNTVETITDLITPAIWEAGDGSVYAYVGMRVTVTDSPDPADNGVYYLSAADYTIPGNWVKAGAGGTWGSITGTLSDQTDLKTSLSSKKIYHGVEAYGAITYDNATQTITLASCTYWLSGVKTVVSAPVTVDINTDHTLTDNTLYYIAFNTADGVLKAFSSLNLYTMVPVCMAFWNGAALAITLETHNHTRNLDWHVNAHRTIGTRYYNGLAIVAPTAGNPTGLEITDGAIYDEDILHNLVTADMTASARLWRQVSSGVYSFADITLPYAGASGTPQYLRTSDYTLQNVGASNFACFWIYASPDIDKPIYIVPTQAAAAHNTLAIARNEQPPVLQGAGINSLTPEFKLIYRWIYKGDGVFQEATDYRMSATLPAGGIPATSAGAVTYSNVSSELTATNVQAAIDELAEAPDGHVIEDDATPMTQRAALNFTGAVTVTDDAVNDATIVDVSGTGTVENLNIYGDYYSYSGTTGDATPLEIFVGGIADTRIDVPLNSAFSFRAQVTAYNTTNGQTKSISYEGTIRNVAGTTALVGSVTKSVIADPDTTGFDADFTADNTNDALILTVTGAAATNVQWFARVDAGFEQPEELGVEWNQTLDEVTRLGSTSRSDFDTLSPWKDMRRCMMNDDGTLNYYIDPADPTKIGEVVNTGTYTTGGTAVYTGADGQVMVEIPKFYYRSFNYTKFPSNTYRWFISDTPKTGYQVHPAFIRPRGGTVNVATSTVTRASGDYFKTTWAEDDVITIDGTDYTIDSVDSTTQITIKEDAGTLTGVRYLCEVGQEVDKVYFSAFEGNVTSSTMRSISGVQPSTSTNVAGTIANFRSYAKARGTGINNWNQQEFLSTCAVQLLYLVEYASFDSQTMIGQGVVNVASGTVNHSRNTGGTIALGNASGSESGTDGLVSISYRGIENFWGNSQKFVDGLNCQNYEAFVSNHDFLHDTFTGRYQSAGSVLTTSDTYVKDIVFNGTDYSFLASVGGGNSGGWLHDKWYVATGNVVAVFGGNWEHGDISGAFLFGFISSSHSARSLGSRLSFIP